MSIHNSKNVNLFESFESTVGNTVQLFTDLLRIIPFLFAFLVSCAPVMMMMIIMLNVCSRNTGCFVALAKPNR